MNCADNCKFAVWKRTSNGRLHPSGDGRCEWVMPAIVLPVSRYYVGSAGVPEPFGGFINRKCLKDCPTWEEWPADNEMETMNKHQEYAVHALYRFGDDLLRARIAFRNCTLDQLRQEHWYPEKTREQIIAEYGDHFISVQKAIEWVKAVAREYAKKTIDRIENSRRLQL